MKNLLIILFLLPFIGMAQTHYYVNAITGNDGNSGSISSPWQSLNKVNSFTGYQPGDIVSLYGGQTFYGTITVNKSGTSGNPITFNSYGTGKATITGFTAVSAWTNLGGNIWESTNSVSSLSSCNVVLINGTQYAMGRWPNKGYVSYQSHNTATSLTSSSLTGTPNWTGALVAMKRQRWYIEVDTITSQSGSTINFTNKGLYNLQDNWGFFILNSAATLDTANEWYFNPSTKKIRIYSTTAPTNVQISTVDKLVTDPSNNTYITFDNLIFTGSNSMGIDFNYGGHETISNCDISYTGSAAISMNGTTQTVTGNTIKNAGYTSINLQQNCIGSTISNNTITKTYPFPGGLDDGTGGSAIYSVGKLTNIQYNVVDSSGWGGINVYGDTSTAQNNFVNHTALLRDDCAGVATHHGYTGVKILNNVILNTISNRDGVSSSDSSNLLAHGIYLDDLSTFVTVTGNTVAYCNGVGQMIHRSHDITLTNNTYYNNNFSQGNFTRGQIFFQYTDTPAIKNFVINDNNFVAATTNQSVWNFYSNPTNINPVSSFGTADSNRYANIQTTNDWYINNGGTINQYNLAGWKAYTGQDAHSTDSVYNKDSLYFIYNTTNHDSIVSLYQTYKDLTGAAHFGSITLPAYSSKVLIKNGSSTPAPTISMSGNQSISIDSTSIYAVPSWASGHTGTVAWTQTSGPNTATIRSATSTSTEVAGLINGTYIFKCTATQDDGQTVSGTVSVTVSITIPQSIYIPYKTKHININLN